MRLKDVLYKVSIKRLIGSTDLEVANIQFDSRKVISHTLFIAIKGMLDDGHKYITRAIENGANIIVLENIPKKINQQVTYVQVESTNETLGVIAANFYNNPSERIKLVGITGTNGKTTIVNLLHQLFILLNVKSGMLSTIENKIVDEAIESTLTTPDALQINFLLNKMIENGCEYCFMEVSSHALAQGRVNGLRFSAAVFTNITHDHLDYHNTFAEYRDVKKSFFDSLAKDTFALTNNDDKNGLKMLEGTQAKKFTYSLKSSSDYKTTVLENQFDGMLLKINKVDVWVKLIGHFNAYNILAVYAIANQFAFEDCDVLPALSLVTPVEGRFQCLRNKYEVTGIVDYAHTEDALRNVLKTVNNIRTNSEQLITIIGCGGNRDKIKRPFMARVACNFSTQVIITSDNPRLEDPEQIIKDMVEGLDPVQKRKVLVINDRRQAIMTAGKLAKSKDIILLAGKGHEKYQEVDGERLPFDDVKELKESLNINN